MHILVRSGNETSVSVACILLHGGTNKLYKIFNSEVVSSHSEINSDPAFTEYMPMDASTRCDHILPLRLRAQPALMTCERALVDVKIMVPDFFPLRRMHI